MECKPNGRRIDWLKSNVILTIVKLAVGVEILDKKDMFESNFTFSW